MRIVITLLLSFLLLGCATDNVTFSAGDSGSHRLGSPVCSTLVCGKNTRTPGEQKAINEAVHEQQRAIMRGEKPDLRIMASY
ncbi:MULTISPECIES: hypothetical protein [Gammaproteobacteria]|uniref:hypothetical protein n=1 Tax=Gammaproteobacteria TaxID=1236 RepID=UPI0018689E4B|nr:MULTISPECIES: hypothetical protein [Gammaproteobacteria]